MSQMNQEINNKSHKYRSLVWSPKDDGNEIVTVDCQQTKILGR